MHHAMIVGSGNARLRLLRNLFLAVLVTLCATGAKAGIITYEFTGTVLAGDGGASSPLTGSFSFDTATPGLGGHYPLSGLMSFSVGPEIGLTGLLDSINISNGESGLGDPDSLVIGSLAPAVTVPFFQGASLYMEFFDVTGTAFTTDLLSSPLPAVSAFTTATFVVREFIASIEFNHFTGTIDSLTVVKEPPPVPEPSTLSLLATAGIMLALAAWRRAGRTGPVTARSVRD